MNIILLKLKQININTAKKALDLDIHSQKIFTMNIKDGEMIMNMCGIQL
nr:MAG TPA: hypothetical protein [Caudoviricetes sp.]